MEYSIAEIAQNLSGPYHIYREGIEAQILAFLSRQKSTETPKTKLHYYLGSDLKVKATGETKAPEKGMIKIIPMEGVIGRITNPYYGVVGTKDLIRQLNEGIADTNVVAQMIVAATPGGSALPTNEAAEAVVALNKIKPIGLYAEELWASAGVFIGVGANKIYASKSSFSGSIGTVWSTLQLTPLFEKFGAKQLTIYANESFDKDLGLKDAMDGKPDKLRNTLVEPFQELFQNHVTTCRPQIKTEALHGMMYLPEPALKVNLIDMICTLEEAVADLFSIASQKTNSNKTIKTNSTMGGPMLLSVLSFFGFTNSKKDDGTEKSETELYQELVQKVNNLQNDAKQKDTTILDLKNQLTEANGKTTAANDLLQKEKDAHQVTKDALTAADPTTRKEELKSGETDKEQKQNTTASFDELEAEYEAEARERNGLGPLKKDK